MFLVQYWGGPRTYSEQRGHPRLRMRHAPFPSATRRATRGCGTCASPSTTLDLPDDAEELLWDYLVMAAHSMVNSPDERPPPDRPRPDRVRQASGPGEPDPATAADPRRRPAWWRTRGHLPDLHPQLRRRRRRRHRRPRRHPVPAALPARPRRRRDLDHAVLPVPDGRRRVRRRRLPRHRAAVRHPGRRRRPDRATRTSSACGSSSTSSPTTPPTSTRGSRRPWRPDPAARSATRYVFRPGRGPRRRAAPNDWQSAFGGPAWTRVPDGEWYLHLFAPEQPDFNWENPEVVDGVRGHPAVLARPRRRRLPHRRRQLAEEGPGLPRRRARGRGGPGAARAARTTRSGTATRCTRSTAAGAR